MKLSAKTVQILKNFSIINPSIMFNKGSVLSTISPLKTVMARVNIEEDIQQDFGIFDLNRFLAVLSLFEDPELILCENFVKVSDGRKSVNFIFADPVTMILPPNKEIKVGEPYISFDFTAEVQQAVLKAAAVLQLNTVAIVGEDGNLFIKAINPQNSSSNAFELSLGTTDKKCCINFDCNNLKLMSKDYKVNIAKGIGHFASSDGLNYWITTESSSKYED